MIDRAQHDHDGRHAHHHVEMRDDEHGIRKRDIHDDVAEEEAGEPPFTNVMIKPSANSIGTVR